MEDGYLSILRRGPSTIRHDGLYSTGTVRQLSTVTLCAKLNNRTRRIAERPAPVRLDSRMWEMFYSVFTSSSRTPSIWRR